MAEQNADRIFLNGYLPPQFSGASAPRKLCGVDVAGRS
jgi:hypothetical protein